MDRQFVFLHLVVICFSLLPFPGHCQGYDIDGTEEVKTSECPPPWFRVGNECFRTDAIRGGHNLTEDGHNVRHNFTSARAYCAEEAPGGDLAQPNDIKALIDYMEDHGMGGGYHCAWYYLGGSDLQTEGDWRWLNGSIIDKGWQKAATRRSPHPFRPPSVIEAQPNDHGSGQDCLAMEVYHEVPRANSLGDLDCSLSSFICERPLI